MKHTKQLAVIAIAVAMFSPLTVQATIDNPPVFPNCEDLIKNPGTKSSTKLDNHYIAGQIGTVTGSDDVYYLGDYALNGNVTQCFCPLAGKGIQTNWWKTDAEVEGWIKIENGSWWHLHQGKYLAKNIRFNCKEVTPIPSITPTPRQGGSSSGSRPRPKPTVTPKPTPTATPSITPTPTPKIVGHVLTATVTPTPVFIPQATTLPRTGLGGWAIIGIALGAIGISILIRK